LNETKEKKFVGVGEIRCGRERKLFVKYLWAYSEPQFRGRIFRKLREEYPNLSFRYPDLVQVGTPHFLWKPFETKEITNLPKEEVKKIVSTLQKPL